MIQMFSIYGWLIMELWYILRTHWRYHSSDNGSGIFLGIGPANEKKCFLVTPPLIGRAHTQNDPFNPYYYASIYRVAEVSIGDADALTTRPACWTMTIDFYCLINTLRLRQNWRHFADDIFKCIFLNENIWISLKIRMKFVAKVPINNIPALVQIMACRLNGSNED